MREEIGEWYNLQEVEDHFSTKATKIFMTIAGMWYTEKTIEKIMSDCILYFFITAMTMALINEAIEGYLAWGDLRVFTYQAPCTITVMVEYFKLLIFIMNRQEVQELNSYTYNTFWKVQYEREDLAILNQCNRQSMTTYGLFCILMQGIAWGYLSMPIFESWGKNASERTLPFKWCWDLPYTESPCYEIVYSIQATSTLSVCVLATTFAVFLFTLNVYVVGQFKILQRKLRITCGMHDLNSCDGVALSNRGMKESYANLRACIKQHQMLLEYMERIENLYCPIMLVQSLGGVLLICFPGLQIILGLDTSLSRTILSVEFLIGAVSQLLLFSWSCDQIIHESVSVAEAAYAASWYYIEDHHDKSSFKRAVAIMIMRARKPCVITVGKFSPMSLETFASLFNTSLSYFTILWQMEEEQADWKCSIERLK